MRVDIIGTLRFLSLALLTFTSFVQPVPPPLAPTVEEILAARLATAAPAVGSIWLRASTLKTFYEHRSYRAAWSSPFGLSSQAQALLAAVAASHEDALEPEDYHLTPIRERLAGLGDPRTATAEQLADLDLLLSDAFLLLGAHLRTGRVNPARLYPDLIFDRATVNIPAVLERALTLGQVRDHLLALAPSYYGYRLLKDELALLRSSSYSTIPAGPTLKPGDVDLRVAAVRRRLEASGEGPEGLAADESIYDSGLEEAVRLFQGRHGLVPDGAVGLGTLRALNVSAEDRARQMALNLERMRWLPRDMGGRHVIVNIAGFELWGIEAGCTTLAMRVVVGTTTTRTPMFSSAISNIVVNPSWYVPESIAQTELRPKIEADPTFLERNNYRVTENGRLVQKPGRGNALGKLKFNFPNPFGVYLHDTPSQSGFARTVRTFSHGCIRLERPLDLADFAFRGDPLWHRELIEEEIAKGRERRINLPRPLPLHLVYWTAWVDDHGIVQLRDDVYRRDAPLAAALLPKRRPG
jgi:murein L,D-transpeptidase YcbB/YkuD